MKQQEPTGSKKFGSRFASAIARFDEENGRDPTLVVVDQVAYPQELLYAMRVTEWVLRLQPDASEHLLLAARSQHICRWTIPRNSYEMNRVGYLRWRTDLKQFHAHKTGEILREVGYDDATIAQVCDLNLKKKLGRDAECQILEDALCLVTLQYQLADLVAKSEAAKMVSVLQKTWKKMSPVARDHALKLQYSETCKRLIEEALSAA